MRVDTQNINSLGNPAVTGADAATGTSSRAAVQNRDSQQLDTVQLSNASSLINLAKNVSSADRQSRIADLTQQIRQGSYQVSTPQTSRAMVASLAS